MATLTQAQAYLSAANTAWRADDYATARKEVGSALLELGGIPDMGKDGEFMRIRDALDEILDLIKEEESKADQASDATAGKVTRLELKEPGTTTP